MMKLSTFLFLIALTATSCSQFDVRRIPSDDSSSTTQTTSKELIGIYTGTFDPPTNSHKKIMMLALEKYHVNQLNIYVNISGTKDFKTSYLEREAMIAGMLGKNFSKVKIMPILQENKEDVIAAIDEGPGIQTLQFSGQDSFDTMPADIVRARNRRWVVIPRGDSPVNIPDNSHVDVIDPIDDTSSSQIRKLIAENRLDEANIDPFVADYIRKKHLYVPLEGSAAEVKLEMYEKVFMQYMKEIKALRPDLNLEDVVLPKYLPEQSISAWPTKFTNLIMTKENLVGAPAENYRIFSTNLLNKILLDVSKPTPPTTSPCDPSQFIHMFQ
jgi:nicotinic acid mononucleotide adenylyltransferase